MDDNVDVRIWIRFPPLTFDDQPRLSAARGISSPRRGIAKRAIKILWIFFERPMGQALLIPEFDPTEIEHTILHGTDDSLPPTRLLPLKQSRHNTQG